MADLYGEDIEVDYKGYEVTYGLRVNLHMTVVVRRRILT